MPINTSCPGCQAQFQLQDELAGQQVQCQNCQAVFVAPPPTPAASMPAPSPPPTPAPPQQDSFGSVFDQVSAPASPSTPSAFDQPSPAAYPDKQYDYQSNSGGSKKGLVVGGVLGCGLLLLIAIGAGGWFAYRAIAGSGSSSPAKAFGKEFEEFAAEMEEQRKESIENMFSRHGEDRVARVILNVSNSSSMNRGGQATKYFCDQAKSSLGDSRASVMCYQNGTGIYEVIIGPVEDLQSFANSLSWAQVANVDKSAQTIQASAQLPAQVASSNNSRRNQSNLGAADIAADLEKQRLEMEKRNAKNREAREAQRLADKKQRDAEMEARAASRLADSKRREREQAEKDADRNGVARPDESFIDWVNRSFTEDSTFYMDSTLKTLGTMDVQVLHQETVSKLLIQYLREHETENFDEVIAAMLKWRTEEVESEIISLVGNATYRMEGDTLMKALETIGSPEAAEKLAVALTDFFSGDGSVNHLIRIGAIAETAVLKYRKHQDAKVRSRVYRILTEIGTTASIEPLKANRPLEKDPAMKQQVKDTIAKIQERHPDE